MCCGSAPTEDRIGADAHAPKQSLDILPPNPIGGILARQKFAVQKDCRNHVREAVVRILLGSNARLRALFASADDIEGDIEDVDIDMIDLRAGKSVPLGQHDFRG